MRPREAGESVAAGVSVLAVSSAWPDNLASTSSIERSRVTKPSRPKVEAYATLNGQLPAPW